MISLIDDLISRLLGMTIEPDLRVPAAIAACLFVVGTLVFVGATALLAVRRLRRKG